MLNDDQYNLELLINYYQEVLTINEAFTDLSNENEINRYKNLVEQLVIIRQTLVDKNLSKIRSLYKPIRSLFTNENHFNLLEEIIEFCRRNPSFNYDVTDAELYLKKNITSKASTGTVDMQQLTSVKQKVVPPNTISSKIDDDLVAKLNEVNQQLQKMTNDEFNEIVIKSSNEVLATLTTNYELMKSDIARYDKLLTEHINKSGINIAEAIEKEHARFVQKIASDSNQIIANVSEAITNEFTTQTNLVADKMKEFDDKAFKRSCLIFFCCVCAIFACSIFSSSWTANKVAGNTKISKVAATCNSNASVVQQKLKSQLLSNTYNDKLYPYLNNIEVY